MKFECAFIYVAPGCNPAKERAVVEGDSINMNVIGCATYAEAEEIAKEMVAKGCTAIELCAGFGNEGIARIKRAVGPGIAVGAVKFDFHPALWLQERRRDVRLIAGPIKEKRAKGTRSGRKLTGNAETAAADRRCVLVLFGQHCPVQQIPWLQELL